MTSQLTRPRRSERRRSGILRPAPVARTGIVAAAAVIAVLVAGVVLHDSSVDLPVVTWFNSAHTGFVGVVTNTVYELFSPVPAILLTVVATAVTWAVRRDLRPAAAFAVVIAGTWLPSAVVKLVVHRARPDALQLPHPFSPAQVDASYPSGHSVFVVAAAVAVVLLLADTRAAGSTRVVAPLVVLIVLCSLLVDGVHFPTDVLASVVWALGVAPFVRAVWIRGIASRIPFLA